MAYRLFGLFLLFFSPALALAGEIMFEGYYRIELSGSHVGYYIQRFEFDPKTKSFQTISRKPLIHEGSLTFHNMLSKNISFHIGQSLKLPGFLPAMYQRRLFCPPHRIGRANSPARASALRRCVRPDEVRHGGYRHGRRRTGPGIRGCAATWDSRRG